MAHSDITTGRIYGCKKGSLTWWHEKGHIVFNRGALGSWIQMRQTNWLLITIVALVLAVCFPNWIFKIGAFFSLMVFLMAYFFEEAWCWAYAFRQHGSGKHHMVPNKLNRRRI